MRRYLRRLRARPDSDCPLLAVISTGRLVDVQRPLLVKADIQPWHSITANSYRSAVTENIVMGRIIPTDVSLQLRKLLLLSTFSLFLAGCAANNDGRVPHPDAFQRQHSSEVRVMSWNVKRNSIIPPDGARHETFARVVRAIDPDVICLQEVMRPDLAEQLKRLMNSYVPLANGKSWQVHAVADNVIISRYPMRQQGGELVAPYPLPQFGLPDFKYGYASALIDVSEKSGGASMYIVAMHNKSGVGEKNVGLRQTQSDSIVRRMRNLRKSGHVNALADNTPIVIMGDMNVVPSAPMQPFETLITGDIADEETFGPDFGIDWDGTDMADARPSHNAKERSYYTWRNDNLPFAPSALDRILFTDSVLSVSQRFVLNTMTMSTDELANLGLQKSDVMYDQETGYYDHLPLVVDFTLRSEMRE
jgi:endonuclease/exonuclease/phosphatase family metal-dependent hydrolase